MTIVEIFSGLVVAVALDDQTSAAAARAFVSGWLATFSAPRFVHSDGGPEFRRQFAALCAARGIELSRGLPYNPQSVARVSRAQRTLQSIVAKRRAEGSVESVQELVARAVDAINVAPSDDKWHISPHELCLRGGLDCR